MPVSDVLAELRKPILRISLQHPVCNSRLGRGIFPFALFCDGVRDFGQEHRKVRCPTVSLQQDRYCEQRRIGICLAENVHILGIGVLAQFDIEKFQNFFLSLTFCLFDGQLLAVLVASGDEMIDAVEFQLRQDVHVHGTALAHVGNRLQAYRGIGGPTRHFIAVVAVDNHHRILAHQIARGELVAAIVARYVARKIAVRLLEGPAIAEFVQVDRGTLQERTLLRDTHQRIERNRHAFGICLQRILRE